MVRDLTSILTYFDRNALQLRDTLATQLDPNTSRARVDILSWLSSNNDGIAGTISRSFKRPLIAPSQGFGYGLDALSGNRHELTEAFGHIFESGSVYSFPLLLKLFIPALRSLVRFRPTSESSAFAYNAGNGLART